VRNGLQTGIGALALALGICALPALAQSPEDAAREVEEALHLTPDLESGKRIYQICAVCHTPEGWGTENGYYPQIAGQLPDVTIKQLADIRARNRDNPTMYPFTSPRLLGGVQQIADVSAYIARLPMAPHNAVGPGNDLEFGKKLYEENCVDCHGAGGEGDSKKHAPRIQGQHYSYLYRQFDWIRTGRRRNADKEMVEQIRRFTPREEAAVLDYVSRLRPPTEMQAAPGWMNPDFPSFARGAYPPAALAGQPPYAPPPPPARPERPERPERPLPPERPQRPGMPLTVMPPPAPFAPAPVAPAPAAPAPVAPAPVSEPAVAAPPVAGGETPAATP
jgi:cytochrome c553